MAISQVGNGYNAWNANTDSTTANGYYRYGYQNVHETVESSLDKLSGALRDADLMAEIRRLIASKVALKKLRA